MEIRHVGRPGRVLAVGAIGVVAAVAAALLAAQATLQGSGGLDPRGLTAAPAGDRARPGRFARPGAALRGDEPARPPDLAAVVSQVHFAFRPQDGAWRGGHTTYTAARRVDGALEVVPFQIEGAAGEPRTTSGEPVAFGAARVARGGLRLDDGPGTPASDPWGGLAVPRGGVVEELANGPAGVELAWRLDGPPPGRGDLEVRVPVVTGAFAGETSGGLHFAAGALGVRFGHGTWIDAAGVATPVPARWTGTEIALVVPADVVEASLFPAVLDPVLGPEQGFDVPVIGAGHGDTRAPSVAWDGTNWLVVWTDQGLTGTDLRGTRVSGSDGAVLDPLGLYLSTTGTAGWSAAVAWNGAAYLVVWDDERGLQTGQSRDVYGVLLGTDGTPIGADEFVVCAATADQGGVAVAANGGDFMAVWGDQRNGAQADVYGARITGAGAVLEPFAVSTSLGSQFALAIACSGSGCLVAWQEWPAGAAYGFDDVYGARLSSAGAVLDPNRIAIGVAPHIQSNPAVAWNGSDGQYLVVWSDRRNGAGTDILGARVSPAGAVLDPSGIPISTASGNQDYPGVAWNGSRYLVAWTDNRSGNTADVWGTGVTGAGVVEDAAGFRIGEDSQPAWVRVHAGGPDFVVAWGGTPNVTHHDVVAARVAGTTRAVLDAPPRLLSTGRADQEQIAVASDGTDFLAVWRDYRADQSDVYGARVRGTDGVVLDPLGFVVASGAFRQRMPRVAWNGTSYLAVWKDHRSDRAYGDIYATRILPDATVVDLQAPINVAWSGTQSEPDVACHAGSCLIVWEDGGSGVSTEIFGAVLTTGGPLYAIPLTISASPMDEYAPRVAWDGAGWLVVWEDSGQVRAARVDAAGVLLDGAGIDLTASSSAQFPAVACDATSCLAVWTDHRDTLSAICGRRVSAAGTLLDAELVITTGTADVYVTRPAVASNGQHYLVAWDSSDGNGDLRATRLTSRGRLLPGEEFALAGSLRSEGTAALAAAGDRFLAGWESREVGTTALVADRVRLRTVTVTRTNDPPLTQAGSGTTAEDTPFDVALVATDLDGDAFTFAVASPPAHGTVTIAGATARYVPARDHHGPDRFTFRAIDTLGAVSLDAAIAVTVTPVNDAPVAAPLTLVVPESASLPITLAGSDVDGDALTYVVLSQPSHGTLSGVPPSLTYAPSAGYSGTDSFSFRANDGLLDSLPAAVSIRVGSGVAKESRSAFGCSSGGGAPSVLLLGALGLLLRGGRRRSASLLALALALPGAARAAPATARSAAAPSVSTAPAIAVPLPPPPPGTRAVAPRDPPAATPPPAAAPPPAPAPSRPLAGGRASKVRVALMPVRAGVGVDRALAELVTDTLVAELADRGLATITSKDVESALGFERQKQLLGCGEQSCLADIAGALGADRVVFGDLAQVRELTVLSLQIFNTRTGTVEKRFYERLAGGDAADLLEATERAGATLFPDTVRTGTTSRTRSVVFSTARPLALVARGGYDVKEPGGFGELALEYRVSRGVRIGAGALLAGGQAVGGAVRAGWYPVLLERLSIYAAADAKVLFPGATLVAAQLGLGVEYALGQRLAVALEAPVTFLASAPAEYRTTYFMPGGSVSWRF